MERGKFLKFWGGGKETGEGARRDETRRGETRRGEARRGKESATPARETIRDG